MTAAFEIPRAFLGFDGDSFCNRPVSPDTFPEGMGEEMGVPIKSSGQNLIASAFVLPTATARLGPYSKGGRTSVYVLLVGTNDYSFGVSGATVHANKVEMANRARLAGWEWVAVTTNCPATMFTGPQNTQRLAGNALTLSNPGGVFDLVLDFPSLPGFSNPAGSKYADGTHWSVEGRDDAVAYAAPLVATMIGL